MRAVNAVLDNMELALKRVLAQNEELHRAAGQALLQLAHEKERIEAAPRPAPKDGPAAGA